VNVDMLKEGVNLLQFLDPQ